MQTNQVNIFEDNDHFFKGKYDSSDSLKDPNPRDTTTRRISLKRDVQMCHSFNAETNKRFHETMPLNNELAKQKFCALHSAVLTPRLGMSPGISGWSQC